MSKTKLPLQTAEALAQKIKESLSPGCKRIEIAGSIRRKKAQVGDIEIVAIPEMIPAPCAQLSLMGDEPEVVSKLDQVIEALLEEKPHFTRGSKNGPHNKNFVITSPEGGSIQLDLFITTPEQWGYIFALRTGSKEFNQRWINSQTKGSLLPAGYSFSGGWLWQNGQRIETPEETDIFNLIGGWIEPERRAA